MMLRTRQVLLVAVAVFTTVSATEAAKIPANLTQPTASPRTAGALNLLTASVTPDSTASNSVTAIAHTGQGAANPLSLYSQIADATGGSLGMLKLTELFDTTGDAATLSDDVALDSDAALARLSDGERSDSSSANFDAVGTSFTGSWTPSVITEAGWSFLKAASPVTMSVVTSAAISPEPGWLSVMAVGLLALTRRHTAR